MRAVMPKADKKAISDWFFKVNGRCLWQSRDRKAGMMFEGWSVRGIVLVVIHHDGGGWDAYLPATQSNRIDRTLEALEQQIEALLGDMT